MKRHELTDEQWALIESLLPKRTGRTGRPPSPPRCMVECHILIFEKRVRPGVICPERFGPWQTVYEHFSNWRREWHIPTHSGSTHANSAGSRRQNRLGFVVCVDGTQIRASAAAAAATKEVPADTRANQPIMHWGAAEAVSGTKLHLVTDGKGTPLDRPVDARPAA